MEPSPPRWQRRKDARPAEIIEAALTLFMERGFAATRLDDVAKQAGVTKGTLYLYFENKEELFKAVVRETVLPNLEFAEHLVADHRGSWSELLWQLMQAWAERLQHSPSTGISKLMIAEASNFPELGRFYLEEVVLRSRRLFAHVIGSGMQAGEFKQVNISMTTRSIVAPMMMAKVWKQTFSLCDGEQIDLQEFARFHYELIVRGLRPD